MPNPKKRKPVHRDDQSTSQKEVTELQEKFLKAFRIVGNIAKAADIVKCSPSHIHHLLNQDDPRFNHDFAKRFEEARIEAVERMVAETERRAFEGVRRLKFTGRGEVIRIPDPSGKTEKVKKRKKVGKKWVEEEVVQPVMVPYVEHEYSDTLAIFLLKAHDPQRFRDAMYIDGKLKNLNLNLNMGESGTQLKTREELIAETERLLAELRGNGKYIEGNGSTNGHTE